MLSTAKHMTKLTQYVEHFISKLQKQHICGKNKGDPFGIAFIKYLYFRICRKLVFLLLFEISLQELLLNIARYWLIVSKVHCECCAT